MFVCIDTYTHTHTHTHTHTISFESMVSRAVVKWEEYLSYWWFTSGLVSSTEAAN
jgi:hypothetical protein